MPKNVQTTIQLRLFHMLARLCLKSFKLVFSSTWTENFQLYKLGFKEAEKPEIKLPTFIRSWRKQEIFKKTSVSMTMLKPLAVWITANCNILRDGITRPPYLPPFPQVLYLLFISNGAFVCSVLSIGNLILTTILPSGSSHHWYLRNHLFSSR